MISCDVCDSKLLNQPVVHATIGGDRVIGWFAVAVIFSDPSTPAPIPAISIIPIKRRIAIVSE